MKNVIDFLTQLNDNNHKDWFNAHKDWYKEAEKEFNIFVTQLIAGIEKFDAAITNLTAKDCTFRIYRDVRFSPNKEPYKAHMAAYVCPKGKKSGLGGYYFHVEAPNSQFIGSHFLAIGIHLPQAKVLQSIREEILDHGDAFDKVVKAATDFELDQSLKLQKTPKGFAAGNAYDEYLKLKSFTLGKAVTNEFMLSDNLLENTLSEFKKGLEFNKILNRAAYFAFDEE